MPIYDVCYDVLMTMQLCFVCRYPTTDYSLVNGGEAWCGSCLFENAGITEPTLEEVEAYYWAIHHNWTEEDLEDFYQQEKMKGNAQ